MNKFLLAIFLAFILYLSTTNTNAQTPLIEAVKLSNFDKAKELIKQGADVNAVDENGASALVWSTYNGNLDMVKYLIDSIGADLKNSATFKSDTNYFFYCSLACIAAGKGHLETLKYLLNNSRYQSYEYHLDYSKIKIPATINSKNIFGEGWAPLHWASWQSNDNILQFLLTKNPDLAIQTPNGSTSLKIAIIRSQYKNVKLLINGRDPNKIKFYNKPNYYTPLLHFSCIYGNDSIINMLIEAGAKFDLPDSLDNTPLFYSVFHNHLSTTKILINRGANYKHIGLYGNSLLHTACYKATDTLLIDYLLSLRLDTNLRNQYGLTPLIFAVLNNNQAAVNTLLKSGADVNVQNEYKQTCSHIACQKGMDNILESLLKYKPIINGVDTFGMTPLAYAVQNNHSKVVKILLNHFTDNTKNYFVTPHNIVSLKYVNYNSHNEYNYLLNWACASGNDTIVNLLLLHDAKTTDKSENGTTPMHAASFEGNISIMEILMKNHASVNEKNNSGQTPIFEAVKNNKIEAVKFLIKHKASINIIDFAGYSPLSIACMDGYDSLIDILLENKATFNFYDTTGAAPLWYALNYSHGIKQLKIAESFLLHGANPNVKIHLRVEFTDTPLKMACFHNADSLYNLLLKYQANPEAQMGKYSPLFIAIFYNNLKIANTILKNKELVNVVNLNGQTPIFDACRYGNDSIIKLLISKNAIVDISDTSNQNALFIAVSNGHLSTVKLLLEYIHDINQLDKYGNSVLDIAVSGGFTDIVKTLLDSGSRINYYDDGGCCLHMAIEGNNITIAQTLLDKFPDIINVTDSIYGDILSCAILNENVNDEIIDLILSKGGGRNKSHHLDSIMIENAMQRGKSWIVTKILSQGFILDKNDLKPLLLNSGYSINGDLAKIILSRDNSIVDCKDKYGYTTLMYAALNNNFKLCQLLMKNGADPTIKNNYEYSAIDLAKNKGYKLLTKKLLEKDTSEIKTFVDYCNSIKLINDSTKEYLERALTQLNIEIDSLNLTSYTRYLSILSTPFYYKKEYLIVIDLLEKKRRLDSTLLDIFDIFNLANSYFSLHQYKKASKEFDLFFTLLVRERKKNISFFVPFFNKFNLLPVMLYNQAYCQYMINNYGLSKFLCNEIINNQDKFPFYHFINAKILITKINLKEKIDPRDNFIDIKFSVFNNIDKYYFDDLENKKNLLISTKNLFYNIISYSDQHYDPYIEQNELWTLSNALKGFWLKSDITLRNMILEKGTPEMLNSYNELLNIRDRKHHLLNRIDSSKSQNKLSQNEFKLINDLAKRCNQLDILNPQENVYDTIKNKLYSNEAFVDFIQYKNDDLSNINDTMYYGAQLMTNKQSYKLFMFTEKELSNFLNNSDSTEVLNENDSNYVNIVYSKNGDKIYDLIWKQLEPYLKNCTTIYISPTGILNRISFAALSNKKDSYLIDKYNIVNIMNAETWFSKKDFQISNDFKIAAFGNINYNKKNSKQDNFIAPNAQYSINKNEYYNCIKGSDSGPFPRLGPGEIQTIDAIARKNLFKNINIFSDTLADEKQFYKLSGQGIDLIHIDTHGKYIRDKINNYEIRVFGEKLPSDPLYRCYLSMAGILDTTINEPENDGYLTAYEVSNLDLKNTKLVVLSACESALGNVSGTEGVYGFQRAFKMAGVEYVLASLWKVDAAATREFMHIFYSKLFSMEKNKNVNLQEIFSETQLQMRNNKKYSDPYYWAAFVLTR